MWKRLSVVWSVVQGDAKMLWSALRHPQAPAWLKWGTAAIVMYLVSPIDFIPDVIPIFGVLDDMVLVPFAIRWLLQSLPAHILRDLELKKGAKAGTAATEVVKPK